MTRDDDLLTAIEWLKANDGEEAGACRRVADFLSAELSKRRARRAARRNKVPVSVARQAMQRLSS